MAEQIHTADIPSFETKPEEYKELQLDVGDWNIYPDSTNFALIARLTAGSDAKIVQNGRGLTVKITTPSTSVFLQATCPKDTTCKATYSNTFFFSSGGVGGSGGGGTPPTGNYTFSAPLFETAGNVSIALSQSLQVTQNRLDLNLNANTDFRNALLGIDDAKQIATYTTAGRVMPQQNHFTLNALTGELGLDLSPTGALAQNFVSTTALQALDQRVTANAQNITRHDTEIADLGNQINLLETGKADASDLQTLEQKVNTNTQDITQAKGDITALEGRVTTNEGNITTNTQSIQSLRGDLATLSNGVVKTGNVNQDIDGVKNFVRELSALAIQLKQNSANGGGVDIHNQNGYFSISKDNQGVYQLLAGLGYIDNTTTFRIRNMAGGLVTFNTLAQYESTLTPTDDKDLVHLAYVKQVKADLMALIQQAQADILLKANDADVVKLTGDQTITGVKKFHSDVEFGGKIRAGWSAQSVLFTPEDDSEKTLRFRDTSVGTNNKFNLDLENVCGLTGIKDPASARDAVPRDWANNQYIPKVTTTATNGIQVTSDAQKEFYFDYVWDDNQSQYRNWSGIQLRCKTSSASAFTTMWKLEYKDTDNQGIFMTCVGNKLTFENPTKINGVSCEDGDGDNTAVNKAFLNTKLSGSVGTLSNLTTTAKTNLVLAINEVNDKASKIGDLSLLGTADKTNIVLAINELKAEADSNKQQIQTNTSAIANKADSADVIPKVTTTATNGIQVTSDAQKAFNFDYVWDNANSGYRNWSGINLRCKTQSATSFTTMFAVEYRNDDNLGIFMTCVGNKLTFANPTKVKGVSCEDADTDDTATSKGWIQTNYKKTVVISAGGSLPTQTASDTIYYIEV